MIIFPAIDIQNGKAVRLKQGRKHETTVFADSPVDAARYWRDQGAEWLHVVDLDGAFAGSAVNARIVGEICRQTGLRVQVGGGIRNMQTARKYLDAGVCRLIIGTMALENEALFREICQMFPGQTGVSLDARAGRLMTRGWVEETETEVADILPRLTDAGAAFIIYTDIERDGMQSGLNLTALRDLLKISPVPVLAAGGVASMDDVRAIAGLGGYANLQGFISGRALYEKTLDFREANAWLKNPL